MAGPCRQRHLRRAAQWTLAACIAVAGSLSPAHAAAPLQQSRIQAASSGEAPDSERIDAALQRLSENPNPIALQSVLQGWVREYPGRIQLESYGQSQAGRTLYMLRIAPGLQPNREERSAASTPPCALLVPEIGPGHDPAAFLSSLYAWLSATDQALPFELCVAVMPDPDGWIEGRSDICLERNFPADWTPWCPDGTNPGPAPLSQMESKALVQWTLAQPQRMGLIRWLPSVRTPGAAPAGSFEAYAAQVLGLPVIVAGFAETRLNGLGSALQNLNQQRDQLAGQVLDVQRLAENLWVVDLEIENGGQDPSAQSSASRLRGLRRSGPLDCDVSGGRLKAIARAPGEQGHFDLWSGATSPPMPQPGQSCRWRLVVEASGQASLFVRFENPALQALSLTVPLQADLPQPR